MIDYCRNSVGRTAMEKQNDKKMRLRIINRSYDFVISEKSVIFAHRIQMCNMVCTK